MSELIKSGGDITSKRDNASVSNPREHLDDWTTKKKGKNWESRSYRPKLPSPGIGDKDFREKEDEGTSPFVIIKKGKGKLISFLVHLSLSHGRVDLSPKSRRLLTKEQGIGVPDHLSLPLPHYLRRSTTILDVRFS